MLGKAIPGILCQTVEFQKNIRVRNVDEKDKLIELKKLPLFAESIPNHGKIPIETGEGKNK